MQAQFNVQWNLLSNQLNNPYSVPVEPQPQCLDHSFHINWTISVYRPTLATQDSDQQLPTITIVIELRLVVCGSFHWERQTPALL